jgi:formylglycine-generating enzyme required for sulfatase activity
LSGTAVGSTATARCNAGFLLEGSRVRLCQPGRIWDGSPARCLPIDCGEPFSPANGGVSFERTSYGASAQPFCDPGFFLQGLPGGEVYCLDEGTWTSFDGEDTWSCEPLVCEPLPAPANGTVLVPFRGFGGVATYACNEGFLQVGEATRTCQANGAWSGAAPVCQAIACGEPAALPNGSVVATGTGYGSTGTLSCAPGWDLSTASPSLRCGAEGVWETLQGERTWRCIPRDCGAPTGTAAGTWDATTTGSVATFRCFPGWTLTGSATRVCDGVTRTWTGSQANCFLNSCPVLTAPARGAVQAAVRTTGATATYTCEPGWVLQGSATRLCGVDGAWTGETPACVPGGCTPLPPPAFGSVTHAETAALTTEATFRCDPGYTLQGPSQVTCTRVPGEPETWSAPAPWCRSATLGEPCTEASPCSAGEWCPADVPPAVRRCAPRVRVDGAGADLRFLWIPGGTFTMGSPVGEVGRGTSGVDPTLEAQREVSLSRPFVMLDVPVLRTHWRWLTGLSPHEAAAGATRLQGCGDLCPASYLTWWSARWYANTLSVRQGLPPCYRLPSTGCTGSGALGTLSCAAELQPLVNAPTVYACAGYRLPTEAEWERAVRAEDPRATWRGNLVAGETECGGSLSVLDSVAHHCGNSEVSYEGCINLAASGGARCAGPVPPGSPDANPWGLLDMLGNVSEWTWDPFPRYFTGAVDPVGLDPLGPEGSTDRILRGGGFSSAPSQTRAASRRWTSAGAVGSFIGFRLVRSLPAREP